MDNHILRCVHFFLIGKSASWSGCLCVRTRGANFQNGCIVTVRKATIKNIVFPHPSLSLSPFLPPFCNDCLICLASDDIVYLCIHTHTHTHTQSFYLAIHTVPLFRGRSVYLGILQGVVGKIQCSLHNTLCLQLHFLAGV